MLAKRLRNASTDDEKSELSAKIRELDRQKLALPHADPFDTHFKRLQYVRYADDFLIGVIGSKVARSVPLSNCLFSSAIYLSSLSR